jgi:cytochrome c oxidase subunit 2
MRARRCPVAPDHTQILSPPTRLELRSRFPIVGPLRIVRTVRERFGAAALVACAALFPRRLLAEPVITPDASAEGHRALDVFWVATAATGVAFALVCLALLVLLVRYRAGRYRRAAYEAGTGKGAVAATLGLAGLVFAGVDLNLVRMSKRDAADVLFRFPSGPGVVRIEVMPQQWAWNVRYPGPDGAFNDGDDVVALNVLRVPVGRPVMLNLKSKDVVHSFFVPNLRLKHDANPGFVTRSWFTVTKAGEYEIVCSQVCGWAHYLMKGTLVAMPETAWKEWLAGAEADAARRFDPSDREQLWGWEWVP